MATSHMDTFSSRFEFTGFDSLTPRWGWLMTLGIVLLALGLLAIGVSVASTVVTVLFLGLVVAAGGIAQIVHAFSSKGWSGFFLHLALGLLYLVAGFIMATRPVQSAVSLTLFLGIFFLASGLIRSVAAGVARYPSWGWGMFSGIVTILLGIYVLATLPTSGLWVIGTLLGIDMLFGGISLIGLAATARRLQGIDRPWRGGAARPSPV